jgi:pimeloyl-ACP methyl ester carboxylesterase
LAGDASYWGQASDVESLRGHLGLDRVVLLGHSAGTRLATAYAARFPDRVAAMVLICPSPRPLVDVPSDAEAIMDRRRGDPVVDAALATRLAGPGDGQVEEWYRRTAPLVYATWGERERVHAARARWYPAAAEAYFSVDPPPDFASRMRSLTAPVLVVAGAEDCVTGLAPVLALARLFPAGQLALLESCGHFPWIEQPEAFHAAVGPFLDAQTRIDGPRWAT